MSALTRLLAVAGVMAITGAFSAPGVSAQRDRLAPTACAVAPRGAADDAVNDAASTPVAIPLDRQNGASADLPPGEPADPETVDQITAVARELAGCVNTADGPRLAALLTDNAVATGLGLDDFTPQVVATGTPEPGGRGLPWEIAWVRVRNAQVLPDGRVRASVVWGVTDDPKLNPIPETSVHLYARVGDRWVLDALLRDDAASDSEAILRRARQGFSEVDSALYAEPTMAGARFSIQATVMVGFIGNDDYGGVGCEMFVFERGKESATVSAFCRTEEALIGRAAYLDVQAFGPHRGSESAPSRCEDAAILVAMLNFSCTVDLPKATP